MSQAGERQRSPHLVLRPSHQHPCIEGWPSCGFEALAQPLERSICSARNTKISPCALYADAYPWKPTRKAESSAGCTWSTHAGLKRSGGVHRPAARMFQIWEPPRPPQPAEAPRRARPRLTSLPEPHACRDPTQAAWQRPYPGHAGRSAGAARAARRRRLSRRHVRRRRLRARRSWKPPLHAVGDRPRSRRDRARCRPGARFPGRLHLLHGQFGDMVALLSRPA